MNFFNKNVAVEERMSFDDRLNSVKSIFRTAYDSAVQISEELNTEISNKESELRSLKATETETLAFINNIKSFV